MRRMRTRRVRRLAAATLMATLSAVIAGGPGAHAASAGGDTEIALPIGADADDIAAGLGAVWVGDGSKHLYRIDPATHRVRTIKTGGDFEYTFLAIGEGAVWTENFDSVLRVGPDGAITGTSTPKLSETAGGVAGVAVGAGALWILDSYLRLFRVDAVTMSLTLVTTLQGDATEQATLRGGSLVAVDGSSVWALDSDHAVLYRYDIVSGAVSALSVPQAEEVQPRNVAATNGSVAVSGRENAFCPVDAAAGTITCVAGDAVSQTDLVGVDGAFYEITNGSTVTKLDPSGTVLATTPGPKARHRGFSHLALGEGAAWVLEPKRFADNTETCTEDCGGGYFPGGFRRSDTAHDVPTRNVKAQHAAVFELPVPA